MNRILSIATGALALATISSAQLPYSQTINPKATYLRTASDPTAVDTVPIDLQSLGLLPGDKLWITRRGDFVFSGANTDINKGMIGVFSASSVLLPSSSLNRVQDAIDAGPDFITFNTLLFGEVTDVPEDFRISTIINPDLTSTITIQVPTGATHLFVAAHDSYYSDNFDPDSNFGVEIAGERTVGIDIQPDSTDNSINRNAKLVPVAILGSASVDAQAIDPSSIRFAGASIRLKNNGSLHYEVIDVNLDGVNDFVAHFNVDALSIESGATFAEVTGKFNSGLLLRGSDSVRIVP